jgi:hypothetical protein
MTSTVPTAMMSGMYQLLRYSRSDCHLCDEALSLIGNVAPDIELEIVDIEPDLALLTRYGTRVPVLHLPGSDLELNWPFDALALSRFLKLPRSIDN